MDHNHGLDVLDHLLVLGQAVEQLPLEPVIPEAAGGVYHYRCREGCIGTLCVRV